MNKIIKIMGLNQFDKFIIFLSAFTLYGLWFAETQGLYDLAPLGLIVTFIFFSIIFGVSVGWQTIPSAFIALFISFEQLSSIIGIVSVSMGISILAGYAFVCAIQRKAKRLPLIAAIIVCLPVSFFLVTKTLINEEHVLRHLWSLDHESDQSEYVDLTLSLPYLEFDLTKLTQRALYSPGCHPERLQTVVKHGGDILTVYEQDPHIKYMVFHHINEGCKPIIKIFEQNNFGFNFNYGDFHKSNPEWVEAKYPLVFAVKRYITTLQKEANRCMFDKFSVKHGDGSRTMTSWKELTCKDYVNSGCLKPALRSSHANIIRVIATSNHYSPTDEEKTLLNNYILQCNVQDLLPNVVVKP